MTTVPELSGIGIVDMHHHGILEKLNPADRSFLLIQPPPRLSGRERTIELIITHQFQYCSTKTATQIDCVNERGGVVNFSALRSRRH